MFLYACPLNQGSRSLRPSGYWVLRLIDTSLTAISKNEAFHNNQTAFTNVEVQFS